MSSLNTKDFRVHYYPSFDGLRAVAIIMVFLYHFNSSVFSLGWIGVDLFFVLSGFLITQILLNSAKWPNFFLNFYSRRALRIFPLYYLTIIVFFAILPFFLKNGNPLDSIQRFTWHFFYLQNIYNGLNGWTDPGYLNHLWTLAIEEQFYILWPLIVFFCVSNSRKLVSVTIFGIALAIVVRVLLAESEMGPLFEQTFTFARMDSLLIGALLAILYFTGNANWLIQNMKFMPLLSVFSFLFFWGIYTYHFLEFLSETFLSISGGLLIFYLFYNDVSGRSTYFSRVLQSSYLQSIGKWSYGFYVIHYPVILIFRPKLKPVLNQIISSELLSGIIIGILVFVVTVLLSALSYNFYEKRFLRLKIYFDNNSGNK